jgi:hypothetical protein
VKKLNQASPYSLLKLRVHHLRCAWTIKRDLGFSLLLEQHAPCSPSRHEASPSTDGAADAIVSWSTLAFQGRRTSLITKGLCVFLSSAQLLQPGNCPDGVYVSLSEQLERWNGVIFVRRGYYQGSVLRFEIEFPVEYPQRAPIVRFDKASIVHPLVDVSGLGQIQITMR